MIEVAGLRVVLGRRTVLNGVSFALRRGEILGLVGPPDAGKSVLLKTLAGLNTPAAGYVCVEGKHLSLADEEVGAAWRARIGMAFQNNALFDALNVFDNVAFPLRRRRVGEDVVSARVEQRLRDVGLWEARARMPSAISGGMQRRVGIARATVIDPDVGLFDDPIAGLDPVTSTVILDLIVALSRQLNMATIIVSNDLPVLFPICTRVVMLRGGCLLYDGAVAELLHSPHAEVVQFVTGSNEGPL